MCRDGKETEAMKKTSGEPRKRTLLLVVTAGLLAAVGSARTAAADVVAGAGRAPPRRPPPRPPPPRPPPRRRPMRLRRPIQEVPRVPAIPVMRPRLLRLRDPPRHRRRLRRRPRAVIRAPVRAVLLREAAPA